MWGTLLKWCYRSSMMTVFSFLLIFMHILKIYIIQYSWIYVALRMRSTVFFLLTGVRPLSLPKRDSRWSESARRFAFCSSGNLRTFRTSRICRKKFRCCLWLARGSLVGIYASDYFVIFKWIVSFSQFFLRGQSCSGVVVGVLAMQSEGCGLEFDPEGGTLCT